MSIFDKKRLTDETFKLDIERMRDGWYTDKYFTNITIMLEQLQKKITISPATPTAFHLNYKKHPSKPVISKWKCSGSPAD